MKKLIFSLLFAYLFVACNSQPTSTTEALPAAPTGTVTPGASTTPLEQMKAVALDETDYIGRVRDLLKVLQEEYDRAAKSKVTDVGQVTVSVDENFNLSIENKLGGHVYLRKVSMKDLRNKDKGMSVLPDFPPREFPGLKIYLVEGRNVQHFKDGILEKEEGFIEFFLSNQAAVEKLVPAIYQAINISKGLPPKQ